MKCDICGDEEIKYDDENFMLCEQLDEDKEIRIEIQDDTGNTIGMYLDINGMLKLQKWLNKEINRYEEKIEEK